MGWYYPTPEAVVLPITLLRFSCLYTLMYFTNRISMAMNSDRSRFYLLARIICFKPLFQVVGGCFETLQIELRPLPRI